MHQDVRCHATHRKDNEKRKPRDLQQTGEVVNLKGATSERQRENEIERPTWKARWCGIPKCHTLNTLALCSVSTARKITRAFNPTLQLWV